MFNRQSNIIKEVFFIIYVQVWCSGSQGTVDRGITASQEQWDGHFFAGIDFIKTSVSKG